MFDKLTSASCTLRLPFCVVTTFDTGTKPWRVSVPLNELASPSNTAEKVANPPPTVIVADIKGALGVAKETGASGLDSFHAAPRKSMSNVRAKGFGGDPVSEPLTCVTTTLPPPPAAAFWTLVMLFNVF